MNYLNTKTTLLSLQSRRILHSLTKAHTTSFPPSYLLCFCNHFNSLFQTYAHSFLPGLQTHYLTTTHLTNSFTLLKRCYFSRSLSASSPNPSVVSCNSTIRANVKDKDYKEAIKIYRFMLNKGLHPDKFTFTFVLKACTCALEFQEGVLVHGHVVITGLERDAFISTGLVHMYCKMGDLCTASKVFDKMAKTDVVACNAMIQGLSQSGNPSGVFEFVRRMQFEGLEPDYVTIMNLVPAVSGLGHVNACRSIHCYVIRRGFDAVVSNGLIDMYVKGGKLDVARQIFELMQDKDDVSWGTMMAGYANNAFSFEVLALFDRMNKENVRLNKASVVSALMAASEIGDLGRGKEIHDCARQQGIDSDVLVATSLISMYAKCGGLNSATLLLQKLRGKDLVAWSAAISAFIQSGHPKEALSLFRDMQNEYLKANKITLLSVLPACAEVSSLKLGKSVHCSAVKVNMDLDISIGTALVSMYAKCGHFSSSLIIFKRMRCKDVATWNALINGYAQIGDAYRSIEMFQKLQLSDIRPDSGTMIGLLPACALLHDIVLGSCTHGKIFKCGFESDYYVKNALIDMYAKCGSLSTAEFLFSSSGFIKDDVSWNVMISGYMHNGHAKDAISTFYQMRSEEFQPNLVTMVSVLPAAAYLSNLKEGMSLHACIIRTGFQSNTLVGNCLIDMYAKCGQLSHSEDIFDEMIHKDTVSYNVMLAAYAVHGQGNHAVDLFSRMQERQVRVDSLSFLNVLSACRYAGLITEGRKLFRSMREEHQMEPELEHYSCMVDLLGRAGLFDEVLDLIKEMPFEPDAEVWGALLGASTLHSNLHSAELAMHYLLKLEPTNPAHRVILSNVYANSGRWSDAGSTRSKIIKTGMRKSPGCSWV